MHLYDSVAIIPITKSISKFYSLKYNYSKSYHNQNNLTAVSKSISIEKLRAQVFISIKLKETNMSLTAKVRPLSGGDDEVGDGGRTNSSMKAP